MACIIFPLIRASEISLGIWITPPFLALCKLMMEELCRGRGRRYRLVGKTIKEKRGKIQGAEGKRVGMSAGN